ncbi:MAG: 30S ribosomal protein S6 [Clostridiales bacterium]|nr:30S ribosomal protein S6 [Clostridiales bacterium]
MLNKYETIFIIAPAVEDKAAVVEKFTAMINGEGKVENVDEWGNRKLAYEIKKNKEGYYVLINFEAKPTFIDELERVYKITDEVIKFITVKKEI